MDKPQPIFLISLPRSGSTLLQKILTVSPEIYSTAEPWILLPQAMLLKREGMRTTYGHEIFSYAIKDFTNQFTNGEKDYLDALREFILKLYDKVNHTGNPKYFLDKTPRYYLIIPFLAELFPEARFILLFRNPLEVLSSILATWFNDRLQIYINHIDIFQGPHLLAQGSQLLEERCYTVQYENLLANPEEQTRSICKYLEIPFEKSMVEGFADVTFKGLMGDPNGINKYQGISKDPLEKWQKNLDTSYRKLFAKRYVKSLGDGTLSAFNTSVFELTTRIETIEGHFSGSLLDTIDHFNSIIKILFDGEYLPNRLKSLIRQKHIYPYR